MAFFCSPRTFVLPLLLAGCATGGGGPVTDTGPRVDAGMDARPPQTDVGTPTPDADATDRGCLSNMECPGALPVCNEVNGTCVDFAPVECSACSAGGTCTGDGFCYDAPGTNQRFCALPCVRGLKCPEGYQCEDGPGGRRLCLPVSGMCEGRPCDFVDCIAPDRCLEETGQCVACLTGSDCATGSCSADHRCVGCSINTDCPNGICDPAQETCVQCLIDQDCDTGQRCRPTTNTCVQCLEDEDCVDSFCRTSSASCVECVQDIHCPTGQRCRSTSSTCVECLSKSDCPSGQDCSANRCVEVSTCDDDMDCPSGTCGATGVCECPDGASQCKSAETCCFFLRIIPPPAFECVLPEDC